MRDPARIPKLLERIRTAWEKHPDLRLGQIVVNVIHPSQQCPAMFYIEDDKLIETIEARYGH